MNDRAPAPGGLALIQELVNSLDLESGADRLDTEEGRNAFGLAPGDVAAARELRESLRAACLAHAGHPAHAPVRELSELLAAGPLLVKVDGASGAASLAPADGSALTARVASAIAEALVSGTWLRLKACEAVTCRWAYYDRSPAGRSRWCDMGVCGARAKMRAYRARKSASSPPDRPG
ncbi:CGNR zinc finger domain-containing protein [Streptomyces alboniger]|uniref:CGNR zinc finger domain-containing protein n=1 Tax=Streptomyces alboniger TaxID=132473 RepID=A0A5J6HN48_STRAD|nr:CGNR zinc finger domain-containing protein [Streptomyces alboniger]QEV18445.1 CGNR zinc finger domain-containing protein [Streptomyces alboniger]